MCGDLGERCKRSQRVQLGRLKAERPVSFHGLLMCSALAVSTSARVQSASPQRARTPWRGLFSERRSDQSPRATRCAPGHLPHPLHRIRRFADGNRCLQKLRDALIHPVVPGSHKYADAPHPLALLRARRDRPHRSATEQRHEISAVHSINLVGGREQRGRTVSPSIRSRR
jgi:hypothetical protein